MSEADRYLDAALTGDLPPVVIVIGPGLGYILEAIERRAATTRIIAIEPFPAIARTMLERRDWRDWMRSGRLTLLTGPHYLGAADAWKVLDARAAAPPVLALPVIEREFPAETARARQLADQIIRGAQANDDARKKFAGRYLLNTLANLPALLAEGDAASLRGICRGIPAIVVAAGPSLDENIRQLRGLDDRVLIVAVDTALRPLRAAGIRPHLVVAVDPSELNAKHLLGLGDTGGSWLIGEGSIDARVFSEFSGRAFSFKVSDHHPWPWLRAHGFDRGGLRAWGSVLTTAFDLACHAGCDPVVFAGADLAYTGGVHYCRGTIHEDAANHAAPIAARADAFAAWQRDHQRTTCTEKDIHGAAVVSTPDFVQFRDWLVSRSAEVQPRRVLNATGAGILRGGAITQIDLATMSFPALADGAHDIHAQISTAWHGSAEGRDGVVARLVELMASEDGNGIPSAAWLEFGGDTASPEQIASSIAAARRSIARVWKSAPEITAHPTSAFWILGWTATFTAAAEGGPAPAVQWQISCDGGASWSAIAGATSARYDHTMTRHDAGTQLRAIFTNASGSAATMPANITVAVRGVIADFNGDRRPDVLWRNGVTGANVIWFMDGVTRTGLGELELVPDVDNAIVGTGDFNGDGKTDLLWRHLVTGATGLWHLDGVNRIGWGELDTTADVTWTVVGTGDFNGDGKSDILWRHSLSGATMVWYMDGLTRTGVGLLDTEPDLSWTIVGLGDFNGDGKPDILWRNLVTGANRVWYLDGITRTGVGVLETEADLNWTAIGAGDFNGDGKPDIWWHHATTGANRIWHMDGITRTDIGGMRTAAKTTWLVGLQEGTRYGRMSSNPDLGIDSGDAHSGGMRT